MAIRAPRRAKGTKKNMTTRIRIARRAKKVGLCIRRSSLPGEGLDPPAATHSSCGAAAAGPATRRVVAVPGLGGTRGRNIGRYPQLRQNGKASLKPAGAGGPFGGQLGLIG